MLKKTTAVDTPHSANTNTRICHTNKRKQEISYKH
jgi:hypothetical protein